MTAAVYVCTEIGRRRSLQYSRVKTELGGQTIGPDFDDRFVREIDGKQ